MSVEVRPGLFEILTQLENGQTHLQGLQDQSYQSRHDSYHLPKSRFWSLHLILAELIYCCGYINPGNRSQLVAASADGAQCGQYVCILQENQTFGLRILEVIAWSLQPLQSDDRMNTCQNSAHSLQYS